MTSTPGALAPAAGGRVTSLDGLRGIAALVVLLHHAAFVMPAFAEVQAAESAAGQPAWVWFLTHTPAHVLWLGEEAVLVFFVLSGYVLTLPFRQRPQAWRPYYARRLVRLYLPVWAAVALAVVLAAAVPRDGEGRSLWLADRADPPLGRAWADALLLDGASTLNTPLWSLQWELVFSLLLPAFLLLGRAGRRAAPLVALGLLLVVGAGTALGNASLRFLPVFGLGVLLAWHADVVEGAAAWLGRRSWAGAGWWALGVTTLLLLTARWTTAALPDPGLVVAAAASGASVVGATLTVVLALHWATARRALTTTPVQWLGVRSFSLYLVHEPLIVTLAFLVPVAVAPGLVTLVAIPLALLVAMVFYRLVEAPSHRLARRAGHRAARRPGAARSPSPSGPPGAGPAATDPATTPVPPSWPDRPVPGPPGAQRRRRGATVTRTERGASAPWD